jgi:hypothetical protein
MPQFRKKPVTIEAVQLSWDNWSDVCAFVPQQWFDRGVYLDDETKELLPEGKTSKTLGLLLRPLEKNTDGGSLLVSEGDWIIKGVKGEFYPCKPDIFTALYDPVEAGAAGG